MGDSPNDTCLIILHYHQDVLHADIAILFNCEGKYLQTKYFFRDHISITNKVIIFKRVINQVCDSINLAGKNLNLLQTKSNKQSVSNYGFVFKPIISFD